MDITTIFGAFLIVTTVGLIAKFILHLIPLLVESVIIGSFVIGILYFYV